MTFESTMFDLTTKHAPVGNGLRQYCIRNIPVIGDFTIGLLYTNGDDWDVEVTRSSDHLREVDLSTPYGSVYGWLRDY